MAAYRALFVAPGDISHPEVPFVAPKQPAGAAVDQFQWPLYGYSPDHRRFYEPPHPLRGPWRQGWRHHAHALLEFPPVIYRDAILQLADSGELFSLSKNTGRVRWQRRVGALAASSPAVSGGSVYASVLETTKGSGTGRIVALRLRDGATRWSRTLAGRTESSPLLHSGRLYVGT